VQNTQHHLIVPGEDPDAFTALLENLTAEYQPETQMQQIIVNEAARAAWELARANREFDKSQHELHAKQANMREWDLAQQAEFERMLRYRTKAERTFTRRWQAAEQLRKLHLQAQQRAFWQNLQQEQLSLSKQRLQLSTARMQRAAQPKPADKFPEATKWPTNIIHLSQIIEVSIQEGIPSLIVYPSPAQMLQRADTAEVGAQVLRRFEFPNGIPPEFAWVHGPCIRRHGIVWEQHFATVEAWRAHTDREEAAEPYRYLPKLL
jgi:hypothetical protein